jgi:SAM-dependent methyltransferase
VHRDVADSDTFCIFDVSSEADAIQHAVPQIVGLKLHRYLDRFYLWVPENDDDQRQDLIDQLFQLIGDDYESLIDTTRNIENIRNLLLLVASQVGLSKGSTVVDYGSGTGLALKPAAELGLKLVGIERSFVMARKVTTAGMTVWSPGDLARQPKDSLPSAFASYVLHLLPHTNGLRLLWTRLRPGSVLVANFHKGEGIQLINDCLGRERSTILQLQSPDGSSHHGPYMAYVKEA